VINFGHAVFVIAGLTQPDALDERVDLRADFVALGDKITDVGIGTDLHAVDALGELSVSVGLGGPLGQKFVLRLLRRVLGRGPADEDQNRRAHRHDYLARPHGHCLLLHGCFRMNRPTAPPRLSKGV
jgi:hypothetical protein